MTYVYTRELRDQWAVQAYDNGLFVISIQFTTHNCDNASPSLLIVFYYLGIRERTIFRVIMGFTE